MNAIFIFLLIAGVWGAFLLPPVFMSRKNTPISTTQEFTRLTARLANVHGPEAQSAWIQRQRVLARRRRILIGLASAAVLSLVAAVSTGILPLLVVHIVLDAVLIWYVAMLLQIKQRQAAMADVIDIRTASTPAAEADEARILASN